MDLSEDQEDYDLVSLPINNPPQRQLRNFLADNDSAIDTNRELLPAVIPINVGGHRFMTRLSTLTKYEDSMLAAMFSGRHKLDRDAEGYYFIDTDGTHFSHILDFLRHGTLPTLDVSEQVYKDAAYFNLGELISALQLTPLVARNTVREAHRALFPNYMKFKDKVVQVAIENSAVEGRTDVVIHASCKSDFPIKSVYFDKNHTCIVESAHVTYGPWDTGTTEEQLVRCLERDLQDGGFTIRPHDQPRRCDTAEPLLSKLSLSEYSRTSIIQTSII